MSKEDYIKKIIARLKKVQNERIFKIILFFLDNEAMEI